MNGGNVLGSFCIIAASGLCMCIIFVVSVNVCVCISVCICVHRHIRARMYGVRGVVCMCGVAIIPLHDAYYSHTTLL